MSLSIEKPDSAINDPKVSILVPIFNASNFLNECLDSITSQTLPELEIICINDGSTDDSLELLRSKAAHDSRILIVNKKNSGYGDTLNIGIDISRGKYIGIIEADDFTRQEMFSDLFSLAESHNAELVKSDFYEVTDGEIKKANILPVDDTDRIVAPYVNTEIFKAQPSIWSAIYSRDFLMHHQIKFLNTPGASFQDTSFNLKTLAVSDRVWLTSEAYVHYRRDNTGSSINSDDKVFAVRDEYEEFERFMCHYPERNVALRGILQALKFETYSWNLSRLNGNAQLQFYEYMRDEFLDLKEHGQIDPEHFNDEDFRLLDDLVTGDLRFIAKSIKARIKKYSQ